MKHYGMKCEAKRIIKNANNLQEPGNTLGYFPALCMPYQISHVYSLTGAKMKSSRLPHEPELLVICAPTVIVPSVVVIAAMRG